MAEKKSKKNLVQCREWICLVNSVIRTSGKLSLNVFWIFSVPSPKVSLFEAAFLHSRMNAERASFRLMKINDEAKCSFGANWWSYSKMEKHEWNMQIQTSRLAFDDGLLYTKALFTFYYVLLHFRHFFAHFTQNLLLHGLKLCIRGRGRVRRGSCVVDGIFSHAIQLRHINLVCCRTEPPSAWFGRFRTTRRFSGRWRSLLEIFTLSRIILERKIQHIKLIF